MPSIITAGDASNGLVVASGNDGAVVIQSGLAGAKVDALSIAADGQVTSTKPLGKVVQVVNFQTGAAATGTTIIPLDDTIPQITEGDQYMSLAITPTNTSNILIVEVVCQVAASVISAMAVALFSGPADAVAVCFSRIDADNGFLPLTLTRSLVAGGTGAITFTVRAGMNSAGTTTFNGISLTSRYGNIPKSSITITEYTA